MNRRECDIVCRYSRNNDVHRLMPVDSVYVSILREPSAQFESQWSYYRMSSAASGGVSFRSFAQEPDRMLRAEIRLMHHARKQALRNPQAFDMGGVRQSPFHKTHIAVGLLLRNIFL